LGAYFDNGGSSLSQVEREIAASVINGRWLAAYPSYAHEIVGKKAGLPADRVDALIAGLPTSFDDPRQQVIYDLTLALTAPRVISQGLYERAVGLLGDRGDHAHRLLQHSLIHVDGLQRAGRRVLNDTLVRHVEARERH
jgi:4-carboxymuconolactone decarboxylase